MNSMKRKLKSTNEIWILTTWWTMNMHMIHEYNQFWSWSKSVNNNIRRSCWLNAKYKTIDYSIKKISLFWTLNFYNLRFLNLLMMQWWLNIQIMQRSTKLYNKFTTDLWYMILWEDMYNSVQHALKKRADTQRSKMYCNSCLFLCNDNKISQLTSSSIYQITMIIQISW